MNNTIISICREYCSGGKEIGKKVSDELGYTFLDKQLITEAAKSLVTMNLFLKRLMK